MGILNKPMSYVGYILSSLSMIRDTIEAGNTKSYNVSSTHVKPVAISCEKQFRLALQEKYKTS